MKKILLRALKAGKAAAHLGFSRVFWYAVYQAGLRSGYFRRASLPVDFQALVLTLHSPYRLPERDRLSALLNGQPELARELLAEAEEITAGQVRLFGGAPVALSLTPPDASHHWTFYEGRPDRAGVEDFKLIWEPARFGWVYPLGRAYLLTGDERFPAVFWEYLETFCRANPPNRGPNWLSAQEVALRLLGLLFAARVFQASAQATPERISHLAGVIATHARRIPLTLSYARAQNNNHLLTEALGLIAAGAALTGYPEASGWGRLGAHWMNRALEEQIERGGVYTQHSMNYHRLMLHSALQAEMFGHSFSATAARRLGEATTWLLAQVDPTSGRAPNLGANDGANIFPLSSGGFADYRPVGQAAARAFLKRRAFPPGPWDELGLWSGQGEPSEETLPPLPPCRSVFRLGDPSAWATLRAANFHQRPSHADQLQVDLWWKGENLALDAGTYRYTAPSPWDNALSGTTVHNTVTVNGLDQMQRAGRFLWLDWAQAELVEPGGPGGEVLQARHAGYARLGVIHSRSLSRVAPGQWKVRDDLLPAPNLAQQAEYTFTLHWLLPDYPWHLDDFQLRLLHPRGGQIRLTLAAEQPGKAGSPPQISLVRAGKVLAGTDPTAPILGWVSPTYNHRVPALSLRMVVKSSLPFRFTSEWILADDL